MTFYRCGMLIAEPGWLAETFDHQHFMGASGQVGMPATRDVQASKGALPCNLFSGSCFCAPPLMNSFHIECLDPDCIHPSMLVQLGCQICNLSLEGCVAGHGHSAASHRLS